MTKTLCHPPNSIMLAFIVFLALSLLSPLSQASGAADFDALVALKRGFHSPEPALASWNPSSPGSVCLWTGVRCLKGRVVSLDLSDLNLHGSIYSWLISRLDRLVNLSLVGNNFTGTVRIENLPGLRRLNISNNQFSGDLDWNYSTIPSLEVFDAYNNNFTAPLPTGILRLRSSLRYLSLGGNYFYGEIHKGYGDLVGLKYLSLAGNDLRGKIPGDLGNLTGLREIYLGYYNSFDGGIPREFGRLINLVHMDLSSCDIDGPIPSELGDLRALDTLYLHINLLSGDIPRQLGNLTRLVNLDLSNNALTGEIPAELANLQQLRLFNLFMNRLHGSVPEFVADLPSLETLELWMNNFTGEIPRGLGRNGRIQTLDLSSNKLTGTIPPDLCLQNQLQVLILLSNFLFGPIPEGLRQCSSLVRVRLGQNYLNGTIPNGFLYLPQLKLLELQNNYLSGILAENTNSEFKPVYLGQLNLANNRLSGVLPSSFSNYSSLQILLLSENQFSGPIPADLGELRQMLKLDLSRNLLSGEIPPQIGNCYHLTFLDLSQNNLSGPVPAEIANIHILNYLNVSRNRLNDTVPKSIGTMKSLTTVDFSFNDLSGRLPESGQFEFFNATSFSGNPRLCGPLVSSPCSPASATDGDGRHRSSSNFKLIFALGLLVCSLIFAAAAVIKAQSIKRGGAAGSWKMTAFQKVEFTVSEVLECVKEGNVIGRGGAGIVYHGKMAEGAEIAVKKLLGPFGVGSHDHGFKAEIQTLGKIRHRNIVRLLAFCSNKETNLLVYEYMRNGSLGEALHGGKKGGFLLGWSLRYKIAVEAAKGLCYLHHDCSPLIVHRDVKSNNILLDSSFEAHVADFGLAKFLVDGGASQCMSAIAGSYGYIAPGWH
ncbi:hypothetical protein SAY86_019043 [Trapa natans]|uniref:non-specific serine/threonine protein kinase n=1 Tax=Trapa natans TaxID=22666 RepID=A0AAN7LNW8_TRANT|nr:hypothetical protein SAY86_019043 [Trapa natans]